MEIYCAAYPHVRHVELVWTLCQAGFDLLASALRGCSSGLPALQGVHTAALSWVKVLHTNSYARECAEVCTEDVNAFSSSRQSGDIAIAADSGDSCGLGCILGFSLGLTAPSVLILPGLQPLPPGIDVSNVEQLATMAVDALK